MSWRDVVDELREEARAQAARIRAEARNVSGSSQANSLALAELVRPRLGREAPPSIRRVLVRRAAPRARDAYTAAV